VLWRRIAGGLDVLRQQQVFAELSPHLLTGRKHLKTRLGAPTSPAEQQEALRLAASLERLHVEQKIALGEQALRRLANRPGSLDQWMLARLGARTLLTASPHHCVPPEVAAAWIEVLLAGPFRDARTTALCITQLGRLTGDRARDLDLSLRERAARVLEQHGQGERARSLRELIEPEDDVQAVLVGDSMPLGLRLGGS
jgi:DNA-K related protein